MSGNVTIHIEKAFCNKPAEVKDSKAGKPIANFTLMTSSDKKNAEGKYDRGPTTFWNCVAFGSQAIKAGELLTGKVGGVDVVGVWVSEEYQEKVYNKVLIFEQGGTLALHDGQNAHGVAKANGYAPEPVEDVPTLLPTPATEDTEDADIPF